METFSPPALVHIPLRVSILP